MTTLEKTVAVGPVPLRRRDYPPQPDLTKTVYGHEPPGYLTEVALMLTARFLNAINKAHKYVFKKNRQPTEPSRQK